MAFRSLHLQGRASACCCRRRSAAARSRSTATSTARPSPARCSAGTSAKATWRRAPARGSPGAVRLRGRRAARRSGRVAAAPRLDAALADRRREARPARRGPRASSTSSPGAQALGLRRGLSAWTTPSSSAPARTGSPPRSSWRAAGASVRVLEARDEIGGGTRTAELTLPGFAHDVCSGCHPMGDPVAVLPQRCRSTQHGLRWIHPPASVAHPLDDEPAVLLRRSLDETARELGDDARRLREALRARSCASRTRCSPTCSAPLRMPRHPLRMARFGLPGLLPATTALARPLPRRARARAARRLRRALDPAARAAAHRGGRR